MASNSFTPVCICLTCLSRQELDKGTVEVFYDAATDIPDLPFVVTKSKNIFAKYEIVKETIVLFKKVSSSSCPVSRSIFFFDCSKNKLQMLFLLCMS